ncbi:MAG: HAMP domain-containing histidine kinase [Bacteroidales bacterium]|nr:HAMP domain-containing histidine kinase [Bacteroidales bacterium]
MLTNLEIAFKNQDDFVSNASHELRTPLTVMISESDYLLSRERRGEEYIEHISGLIKDLKALNSLLNSLLELAQLNQDKCIRLSRVRIDEIIFSAIHQAKIKYPGRKIIPKIRYPENGDDLIVNGNSGLLEIAFKNLIDNAFKFSNEDVCLEFAIKDRYIYINILDKGVGIPAKDLESIYRPFKRASNVKYIGGYGIGLSLASNIFKLHDITIKVFSTIQEGTRFELLLKRPE